MVINYFVKICQYLSSFSVVKTFISVLAEVDHINVSLIDRVEVPHLGVGSLRDCSVDTSDRHSVSRLDLVHQVTMNIEDDSVRCLT